MDNNVNPESNFVPENLTTINLIVKSIVTDDVILINLCSGNFLVSGCMMKSMLRSRQQTKRFYVFINCPHSNKWMESILRFSKSTTNEIHFTF